MGERRGSENREMGKDKRVLSFLVFSSHNPGLLCGASPSALRVERELILQLRRTTGGSGRSQVKAGSGRPGQSSHSSSCPLRKPRGNWKGAGEQEVVF